MEQLGAALRTARRAKGLGLKDVGKAAGVSAQAVGQWERGENGPSMTNLIAVGRLLEIDVDAVMRGNATPASGVATAAPVAQEAIPGPDFDRSDLGPRDVPVLGTAWGGTSDDERGIDFWLSGDIENHVARPKGLARAKNVFCLYVGGTSMEPRFEARDLIFVQKTMPGIGDDVVIELYPPQEGGDHPTFIKRLVSRNGSFITVKQYNPPKQLEFSFKEIKNLFRVVPTKELVG